MGSKECGRGTASRLAGATTQPPSRSEAQSWHDRREGTRLHRQLRRELKDAGCFEASVWRLAVRMVGVLLAYASAYAGLLTDPEFLPSLAILAVLAAAVVQAGFVGHEAGHLSLTPNGKFAALFGQIYMTLIGGMTYAFFQHIHQRHHPNTNTLARDPDLQSDLFSLCPEAVRTKRALGSWITAHQGQLVWLFANLQAFSFKLDSCRLVLRNLRATRTDQVFLLLHVLLWFVLPSLVLGVWQAVQNYAIWTWLVGPYLAAVFYVNHVGAEIIGDRDRVSFLHRQLATTRNVGSGCVADFIFGGLNNHIEHHLFPDIPTGKLRVARPITRAFCARHRLRYRETSWPQAVCEVLRHLHAMSALARALLRQHRFQRA